MLGDDDVSVGKPHEYTPISQPAGLSASPIQPEQRRGQNISAYRSRIFPLSHQCYMNYSLCTHAYNLYPYFIFEQHSSSMIHFVSGLLSFAYLVHLAYSFAPTEIYLSKRKGTIYVSFSPNNEGERMDSIPLVHSYDDWHTYCENVDANMEGLVSPSPESFHVVHLALKKANADFNRTDDAYNPICININDIMTLSRFLVKPNYAIELFHDNDLVKWRLIQKKGSDSSLKYTKYTAVNGELYHDYSTLQLSQLVLEFATNATHDYANQISKIQEVVCQAEVSFLVVTHLWCFLIGFILTLSLRSTSVETNSFDIRFRFKRPQFCRCMLQLRPLWCAEFIKFIPESAPHKYSRVKESG